MGLSQADILTQKMWGLHTWGIIGLWHGGRYCLWQEHVSLVSREAAAHAEAGVYPPRPAHMHTKTVRTISGIGLS